MHSPPRLIHAGSHGDVAVPERDPFLGFGEGRRARGRAFRPLDGSTGRPHHRTMPSEPAGATPQRTWPFLGGAYLALLGLASGWFLLWYGPLGDWADRLGDTQGGAILAELLNLPFWVVVTAALVRWGGFRLADLGVRRSAYGSAVVATAALWALLQGVMVVATMVAGEGLDVRLGVLHRTHGVAPFLVGVLSVALGEEIFFRGFLQRQLYVKTPTGRPAAALAVSGAAVLFAAAHLPRVVFTDRAGGADLLPLLVLGVVFGIVYHVTGNLIIAVGLHALADWPVLVVGAVVSPALVLGLLATGFAVWAVVADRRARGLIDATS